MKTSSKVILGFLGAAVVGAAIYYGFFHTFTDGQVGWFGTPPVPNSSTPPAPPVAASSPAQPLTMSINIPTAPGGNTVTKVSTS